MKLFETLKLLGAYLFEILLALVLEDVDTEEEVFLVGLKDV